jgi:hypothetical protein
MGRVELGIGPPLAGAPESLDQLAKLVASVDLCTDEFGLLGRNQA